MPYQLKISLPGDTLREVRQDLKNAAKITIYARHVGQGLAKTLRPLIERTPKAPKFGGTLRKGWARGFRKTGPIRFELINPVAYAAPVEFGSKPHVILPKKGKFLVFESSKGRRVFRTVSKTTGKPLKKATSSLLVFARKVNHPGTKPVRMLERTLPEMDRAVKTGILSALKEAIP